MAATARYVTTDNWLVECAEDASGLNNNFIAHSPDGKTYHFNKRNKAMGDPLFLKLVGQNIWYPSEVLDKFGNKLSYEYYNDSYYCVGFDDFVIAEMARVWDMPTRIAEGISGPVCPISYKIKNIKSSPGGRQVDFIYEKPRFLAADVDQYKHGSRRIKEIVVGDSVWKYRYEKFEPGKSNYLSEVELPDGSTWSYTKKPIAEAGFAAPFGGNDWARSFLHPRRYDGFIALPDDWNGLINRGIGLMDTVTTPMGATIQYGYEKKEIKFFDHVDSETKTKIPVLTSREVSGHELEARLWSYEHTKNDAKNEFYTTVSEPNAANGDLVKTKYTFDHGKDSDHYGVLIKEQKYGNDILLLTKEMKWKTLGTIGIDDHVKERPKSVRVMRALEELRITNEDGLVYITEYSDFDRFGKAKSKVETAPTYKDYIFRGGELYTPTRISSATYFSNTDKWIVGISEDNTVFDTVTGDIVIDKTFDDRGVLQSLNDKGVINNFEYYTEGDIKREYWSNLGKNYETKYFDYKRGVAQKVEKPEKIISTQTVDDDGFVIQKIDSVNNRRDYKHDPLGRITEVKSSGASTAITEWNYEGSPRNSRTTQGLKESVSKSDSFGNIISTMDKGNDSGRVIYTLNKYGLHGKKIFVANPSFSPDETEGVHTKYDALGRQVEIVDPKGNEVTFCYKISCIPEGYPYSGQSYEGRLVKVQTTHIPDAGDESGSVSNDIVNVFFSSSFSDPMDAEVVEVYQQKSEINGDDRYLVTAIDITTSGATKTITQGGKNEDSRLVRSFTYHTGTQSKKTITNPETGLTQLTYDDQGNLWTKQINDTPVVTFSHDGLNRLTYEDFDNSNGTPDKAYGYDYQDNLKWSDNGFTRWEYWYNSEGALTKESLDAAGVSLDIRYEYDQEGNLWYMVFPNGEIMYTNNDAFNQSTRLGDYVSAIKFHPNNVIKSLTYGNGVVATYGMNSRNYVNSVDYQGVVGGDFFETYQYDFRGSPYLIEGNITLSGVSSTSMIEDYKYDAIGFVRTGTSRVGTVAYDFDGFGNILNKTVGSKTLTYGYDSVGAGDDAPRTKLRQVHNETSGETKVYEYNGFGSITNNGKFTFVYDHNNRLREVPSLSKKMYYDGQDKRSIIVKPGETEISLYSKNGVLISKINTLTDKITNYVYLGEALLAKNEAPCGDLCKTGDVKLSLTSPPETQEKNSTDLSVALASNKVKSGTLEYEQEIKNNEPAIAERLE